MSGRRVLVTGGAGFIGSHVCDAYLTHGWEVTALDDLSRGRPENLSPGIRLVEMDVRSAAADQRTSHRASVWWRWMYGLPTCAMCFGKVASMW